MFAYNFPSLVTLDAFSSAVPGADSPFGIQHKNRVVADRFHKQAEALLAPQQRGPLFEDHSRLLQLGNIPKPLFVRGQPDIALRGNHGGMFLANFQKWFSVFWTVEAGERVCT